MKDDEQDLCRRARGGDLSAASELVSRFYERIFAYHRRLCGNHEDAADLTQHTFTRVWRALGSYQGRSSFNTWLHGIAHHVYVDWRRKRNAGEIQSDEWWAAQAAESPGLFEDARERDLCGYLYRCVDQLDEEKKQAIHLHYYQSLSLSETAEALGVATSTVKYRLREALDFLRTKVAEPGVRR
ncbi:MAG TPA: RNA polymerase sigma factor [Methylomirabilota bacterium]|nr:RNA polymerase sigma factor [Methylomirabilota bacterium]